jgi:hypothetical protein
MEVNKNDGIPIDENESIPTTSTPEQFNETAEIEHLQRNKNKTILVVSFVSLFLLLASGLYIFFKSQTKKPTPVEQDKLTEQTSQDLASTSNITIPTPVRKPIYTTGDYVVFAHYGLGYTIKYPATNLEKHLVGATGGNFIQEYNDGGSILIYDIYPEKNTLSKVTIDNIMQQLTECGGGGCSKFFESKDYEKLLEKKIVSLSGTNSFWIKTTIRGGSTNKILPHPIGSTIERYVIPHKGKFLILELNYKDKISNELSKAIDSFRLIPNIPSNWVEYKKNDNSKIRFKHPKEYKITENISKKQIEMKSSKGTITLDYYDKNDELGKLFIQGDYLSIDYIDLESSYKAEQFLGNDITSLKFSLNAFTYSQGGNEVIRVFNPSKQQVVVYFYVYDSPLIYRITSPESMETEMNQILMSVNELIWQ